MSLAATAVRTDPHPGRRDRMVALVLRPTSPPLACLVAVASLLLGAEVLVVRLLDRVAPDSAFGAVFLFGVLVVSAGWELGLSVAMSVASATAYALVHAAESGRSLLPAVVVFSVLALMTNVLVGQARLRAAESDHRRREADRLAELARTVVRQQTALRRVATLVALRADQAEVYAAVTSELADVLGAEHVSVVRFETDGLYEVVAARDDAAGEHRLRAGERLPVGGNNVCTLLLATGDAVNVDYAAATGPITRRLQGRGLRQVIGVPVTVEGRVWGGVVVGVSTGRAAPELPARMADFADLVATAVSNSETRAALTRSRARVVEAADQARRTLERDLHDGAQQRIVSLGLELRATQAAVPADQTELQERLDRSVEALSQIHTSLQELSRGIHPAILSRGGLAAALKTLARRSPVPVSLTVEIPNRLPDAVEVASYYVVAEALTNVAKYARATQVTVSAATSDGVLDLVVADDGVGGARPGAGSGLVGLQDRIDVAGGSLTFTSPVGVGTTLVGRIPYRPRA